MFAPLRFLFFFASGAHFRSGRKRVYRGANESTFLAAELGGGRKKRMVERCMQSGAADLEGNRSWTINFHATPVEAAGAAGAKGDRPGVTFEHVDYNCDLCRALSVSVSFSYSLPCTFVAEFALARWFARSFSSRSPFCPLLLPLCYRISGRSRATLDDRTRIRVVIMGRCIGKVRGRRAHVLRQEETEWSLKSAGSSEK